MTASRRRVPAIVQARMSSRRLPGKVLRDVAGKPLLQYVLERVQDCPAIGEIVVATSVDHADDAIVEFCRSMDVPCARGPMDDVAGRFEQVVDASAFDCFARICGDRPLLDPRLLEQAAALYGDGVDVVTNVWPPTFPPGQTVEIVRADAFARARACMREAADREHVTRYFYRHGTDYRIVNFTATARFDDVHLAVDTEADLQKFSAMVARMERPHWSYGLREVVALYREVA
jgi:spore coat polysaccharide biosynthesis protein SpsF